MANPGARRVFDHPTLERGASRYVYGAYPLLCAAAVLSPRFGSTVRLPEDIPVLVGQAYGQTLEVPEAWRAGLADARRRWLDETEQRTDKARNFQISEPTPAGKAILGWVSGSVGEADDESQDWPPRRLWLGGRTPGRRGLAF